MITSSDGDAMNAEAAPDTAALLSLSSGPRSFSSLQRMSCEKIRFVPNCEAVIGAILTQFI
jgi:hypothetical protein